MPDRDPGSGTRNPARAPGTNMAATGAEPGTGAAAAHAAAVGRWTNGMIVGSPVADLRDQIVGQRDTGGRWLKIAMILIVAVITPAWALYEWFNAYRSTPEARHVADRLISAFMVAMFGLASLLASDFVPRGDASADGKGP